MDGLTEMTKVERKEYEIWNYPLVESTTCYLTNNTSTEKIILNYYNDCKKYVWGKLGK